MKCVCNEYKPFKNIYQDPFIIHKHLVVLSVFFSKIKKQLWSTIKRKYFYWILNMVDAGYSIHKLLMWSSMPTKFSRSFCNPEFPRPSSASHPNYIARRIYH